MRFGRYPKFDFGLKMSYSYTGDRDKMSNWVLGRGGESCNYYCQWMGRQCDPNKQSELTTEKKIEKAMKSAGIDKWLTAWTFSDFDNYEPPREVGPTFYHQLYCSYGYCWYKTEYTKSACYIPYRVREFQQLCYCEKVKGMQYS